MDEASFFLFNVFLNGLLSFITAVLLMEGIVALFRIRQGRAAALLRMIPVLKLPLDLFLYDFSKWSYLQGINPLDCEEGTRTLSASFLWSGFSPDCFFLPIRSIAPKGSGRIRTAEGESGLPQQRGVPGVDFPGGSGLSVWLSISSGRFFGGCR